MFRSSGSFDRLLDKATSNLLLETDWNSIMGICDSIRSGETMPKYAVAAIKKKFYHENPHVVMFALEVMESCVKNCGSLVHDEVATKGFMEEMRDLIKHSKQDNIKNKLLEMLQTWGMNFRSSQKYRIVTDTLDLMKVEGWQFPPVREAEAMYEADNAPEWAEGEVCHRCRTQFGMVTRQHHCRACGQVFCGKCSSKSCPLPKFGIEREVRVCDSCFDQYGSKDSANSSPSKTVKRADLMSSDSGLPAEYLASSLAQQSQAPPPKSGKTDEELKEEEELQLAIALSQSEAQAKEDAKKRSQLQSYSSPKVEETKDGSKTEDISPELMRYLNRDYWEQKEKEKAEGFKEVKVSLNKEDHPPLLVQQQPLVGRTQDPELDEFVTTLKTQVEIFVNRMKSNSSRGRSITNDSSVQTLFMNTMAMHSKLLKHIQDQEDKRVYYEGLQDKIAQVKDARAALDALREEERERKRREAEEAERLRQIQMREKLEVMRKKKQEYLQYQRQIALQRMQEQEREMKLRQEQAKQQYMMQMQQQPYGAPTSGQPTMYPAAVPQYMPPYQGYMAPPQAGAPMMAPGAPDAFNMQQVGAALPPGPQAPMAYTGMPQHDMQPPQMMGGGGMGQPPPQTAPPQQTAPTGQPMPGAPAEAPSEALISFD